MAGDEIFCICFILNLIIHGLKEYLRLVRNILTFIVIIKASLTLLLCCKCGQASHARTLWMNQNAYTLYLLQPIRLLQGQTLRVATSWTYPLIMLDLLESWNFLRKKFLAFLLLPNSFRLKNCTSGLSLTLKGQGLLRHSWSLV